MFSLIVTIISIALVAALAIATIYYGGNSFLEGSTRTAAATLLNQGAQIAGSTMLYSTDQQTVPSRPSDLVGQHYLKELPLPPKVAYFGNVVPKQSDWEWFSPTTVHVVLRNKINEKTCREINIKANQTSDIPPIMKPEWIVQCYGLGEPYTFYFDPPGVPQSEREEIARTLSDPLVDVAPDPVDFGTHLVGSQSPSTDIVVSNIGGGVLIVLDMAFNGDFDGYSDCLGSVMWNGQACTVTTWFEPSAVGVRSGSILIENNSIDNPYSVSLTGRGSLAATPALTFSPNPVIFPDTAQTSSSAPLEVTVSNVGSAPFSMASPVITGPYSASHNCPASLDTGRSCQLQLTFSPLTSGSFPGELSLSGNLVAPAKLPLWGTGTSGAAPKASLSFVPDTLTFANRELGTTSPTLTSRMVNVGFADFELGSISTSAPFSLTHNCPATLSNQGSCDISVKFDPTTVGTLTGLVTVTGNIASPGFVTLTGSSWSGPIISVDPASLTFGSYVINAQSAPVPVTVTNTGNGTLAISDVTLNGSFSSTSDCVGANLSGGQSCQINVVFQPASLGSNAGTLAIHNNSATAIVEVPLVGTGAAAPVPALTLTPANLSFATIAAGATSPIQTATLANVGSAPFVLSTISTSGPFTTSHNCPASLAAGSSCTISSRYAPTLGSATTGSTTISGNVLNPLVLGYTGSYHSLVVTQNNLAFGSIPTGSSATATVTVSNNGVVPLSGFSASMGGNSAYTVLSNNCSTLNINASCSYTIRFAPTSVGTSNTTVTVSTGQGATATAAATGSGVGTTLAGAADTLSVGDHTCGVTASGGVKCWGLNGNGQLGNGTNVDASHMTSVTGLGTPIASIASGYRHTCALTTSGGVKCWGNGTYAQLGAPVSSGTWPVYVAPPVQNTATPIDATGYTSGVTSLSVGYYHSCVTPSVGTVKCWGSNTYGQLGDNSVAVSGITDLVAGGFHTCIIDIGGGLKCWGRNALGQLGDNTLVDKSSPVWVSGLSSGVTQVSLGYSHTCAVTTAGGAKCWGDNFLGQIGNGVKSTNGLPLNQKIPVDVVGLTSGVAAISVGNYFTCALTTAGGVKCWGYNNYGQIGDGTPTGTSKLTPVDVVGLSSGVVAISTGHSHACAKLSSGVIKCWGNNSNGRLGDGGSASSNVPVTVIE